jgi:peptidoglycan/xylan/chitin deacetylase (PgdA/CDA1 family)
MAENGLSILMYHQVGPFAAPQHHRATFCHVRRFKAQMAWLHFGHYPVLDLGMALAALAAGKPLPPRAVALTFDDGYQNFYDHAFPILRCYGLPATVFLVAGCIGGETQWLRCEGRTAYPLMDGEAIGRLADFGIGFGSHTMHHPFLTHLSAEDQYEEITASRHVLEELLKRPVDLFSYPDGDHDVVVAERVRRAGYAAAVTCLRGRATAAHDPYRLPRKAISYGDSLVGFWWKLHVKNRLKT